ncbi:MAG: Mrp/NBP35 family ATP-binding protein [Nitrospira sp.]|nr:Mrp/NBP35 family ATP-binding protein [Nitrospira sp.]MCB9709564.1 Mrp/NBP35 family ATP-binding protein [Nitrospiraceae bacterium]MDR4487084.1 Mrp/NBP35 family ATP-binding protein [Nitrospirales bacterium]MCA9464697.1 Mrp/NBP35 family ATP-binding protein [Nitrospira sp.]MCA9476920.1 Mrp/NBP35 family ATP-binding protein [Nitrospira sp.]
MAEQGSSNTSGSPGHQEGHMLPGVKHIIAVSSGKGGVGKSTVTVNLSVALQKLGYAVGLMDADIYGPNIPMMMGVTVPPVKEGERIHPADGQGVKVMSMGFFVPEDTPVVWRGPMVHGAIQQFFRDVNWGELDFLLIDLPPGTGDVPLTLSQLVPLTGAITVTTPQEVALSDVRKGMMMFQKVNVPLLGVIENMSYFVCGHCGERSEIFSSGGGERAAQKFAVPFLGRIPIDPAIREGGDSGKPIVIHQPSSPQAQAFLQIAQAVVDQLAQSEKDQGGGVPSMANLLKKIKEPLQPGS